MQRRSAALDLNGNNRSAGVLDDVGYGDEAQPFGAELDGAGPADRIVIVGTADPPPARVYVAMDVPTLHGVGIVLEPRLNPLKVKETLAVLELVDHPSRDQIRYIIHATKLSPAGRMFHTLPDRRA